MAINKLTGRLAATSILSVGVLLSAPAANAATVVYQFSTDATDTLAIDCSTLDYANPRNNFVDADLGYDLWAELPEAAQQFMTDCTDAQAEEARTGQPNLTVTIPLFEDETPVDETPVDEDEETPVEEDETPAGSGSGTPATGTPNNNGTPAGNQPPVSNVVVVPQASPAPAAAQPVVLAAATSKPANGTLPETGSDASALALAAMAASSAGVAVRFRLKK